MSIQIVNVDKPNSVKNSCVFAVYEAPDSSTNLHIALNRFKTQISDIQTSSWKLENIVTQIIIVYNCFT